MAPNQTSRRPTAVIFDVDGTLCDVSSIQYLVHPNHPRFTKKNMDAFHRESVDCPVNPTVLHGLNQARSDGHAILVVTARAARYASMTCFWMSKEEIQHDFLFTRRNFDSRPDVEVKRDIYRTIARNWDVVHAWDDNPNVIALWDELGIPVTVVPGPLNDSSLLI